MLKFLSQQDVIESTELPHKIAMFSCEEESYDKLGLPDKEQAELTEIHSANIGHYSCKAAGTYSVQGTIALM